MIRQMRDNDVKKFLASLIKEICFDQNPEGSRQMACVICKNLISGRSGDQRYAELWVSLEASFKQNCKDAIIQ